VRKGQSLGDPDAKDQYSVDHTGTIFLIGKDGRIRKEHPHDAKAEVLLKDVRSLLEEGT
jgi:cytochrome oxidase Cu insertion factor (SCO1/SenC/PrrC family)